MEKNATLVFVDIETAGLKRGSPIIELAAVAVAAGTYEELDTIEMKIAFQMKDANVRSLGINKFSPSLWQQYAIPEQDAAKKFSRFLREHATEEFPSKKKRGSSYSLAKLVAYNARWDTDRLETWSRRNEVYLPAMRMSLCVLQRTLWFFGENQGLEPPRDYKLASVAEHLGLRSVPDHSALADVKTTVELARVLAGYNRITTTSRAA